MLWLILIVGGLLIMMGQHDRSEALFYYFRLQDAAHFASVLFWNGKLAVGFGIAG